jgi:hypothetical protein
MLTRRPLAGKVFKIGEDRASTPPKMEVHASFGGLLMLLKARALRRQRSSITNKAHCSLPCAQGEPSALKDLDVDMRIYLLARKI